MTELNHQSVTSVSEFEQAMRNTQSKAILLRIVRDGTGLFMRSHLVKLIESDYGSSKHWSAGVHSMIAR